MESFRNPYHLPEAGSSDEYEKKKKFVIWYWEHWLPAIAGQGNPFRDSIRHFQLPSDKVPVEGKLAQKEDPEIQNVTKESEAFGYVMYQNCYTKWSHIIPKKVEDADWEMPPHKREDESTHKYHQTEWSDGRNGQMKGQGWSPLAYVAMNDANRMIRDFRREDGKNGCAIMKKALNLVKETIGIPLEQTEPDCSKKRKRGKVSAPLAYTEIEYLSDDD